MNVLQRFSEVVDKYVRPETYPVAIKVIGDSNEIPEGIQTVKDQLGVTMPLCQGWGKARFNGESLAMMKEDISCPIALFTLGLAEPPDDWSEGDLYYEWYTPEKQAAEKYASSIPRLPKGKYIGAILAPVHDCNFDPDVVITYCNPMQLMLFIPAALSREGGRFENSIFPPGVCTDIIAPVMQTGKCRFGIPCFGDRKYEYTSRDELVFSVPFSRLEEVAEGLKFFGDHDHTFPLPKPLNHANEQREEYRTIRAML